MNCCFARAFGATGGSSRTNGWSSRPDGTSSTLPFEGGSGDADYLCGYGYQFWMSRHGYHGDGAFGQLCVVVPSHDLVVAVTAATTQAQAILDTIWECLLPGMDQAGSTREDEILADRLRRLSFAPVSGSAVPDRSRHGEIDASAEDSALPDGTTVIVDPVDGGWLLRLGASLRVEVGHGEWRESSPLGRPVVAAGAWQGNTFVAELYVITTPHRVRLVVDADAGTAVGDVEHRAPDQPQPGVAFAVAADDKARRRVGDVGYGMSRHQALV